MKQTPLIFLLLVLLTACAAPTPSSTATVTASRMAPPVPSATDVAANTPIPTFTPTPPPAEFSQLAPETMGCLKPDMCLGLEVKDKQAAYQAVVGAFYGEYENRDWMKQMKIGSLEAFKTFLKNSTHVDPATGEERAYWIPLTAPNGATFKILQGNGTVSGGATFSDENPAIVEQGGFWLDYIGFVAASKTEIDTNTGGVADWLEQMWKLNGKDVLIVSGSAPIIEGWAMAVGADGRLKFVTVNAADPPQEVWSAKAQQLLLGHSEGKNDAKIVSAQFELYLEACRKYKNYPGSREISNKGIEPDPTLWEVAPPLVIADNGYGGLGGVYGAPTWFVPQDSNAQ